MNPSAPKSKFLAQSTVSADQIDTAAAAWVARRDAGWSEPVQAEFETWLSADPRHREAWNRLGASWAAMDRARTQGQADLVLLGLARSARRRQNRRLAWASAAVALILFAGAWWRYQPRPNAEASLVAAAVSTDRVLPDGSRVELNRGAEIEVDFRPEARRVRLVRGEAHFSVTHDLARPFLVSADQVEVRAVGTAFAVRYGPQNVEVLVTEGRVNVADHPKDGTSLVPAAVAVGQRVAVSRHGGGFSPVEEMTEADYREGLGWRAARLDFSGTPLAEAVRLFNTHHHSHLVIEDPQVAELQISGLFRADNADGFVRALATTFDLEAVRKSEREVLLRRTK